MRGPLPPFETVVVDFDDTLVATYRAAARARRHLRQFGVDPRKFARVSKRWWRRVAAGEATMDELRVGRFADVGLTGELAEAAGPEFQRLGDAVSVRLGARRLVADLRAAGKRVVILTNFEGQLHRQRSKIARVGFAEAVDGVVITGDIGVHKPDRRAFQAALDLVGGRPERAAMFGDNFVNDIQGALDAGFARAVWITRRRRHPDDPRLVVVRNLAQARVALLGVNGARIADPGP